MSPIFPTEITLNRITIHDFCKRPTPTYQISKARRDGCTPLAMALQRGQIEVAALLKSKLTEPPQQSSRDDPCMVCMDVCMTEVVLIPCGHRNLCGSCALRWVRGRGKGCPVDRSLVAEIAPLKRHLVAEATPTLEEEKGEEPMKKKRI